MAIGGGSYSSGGGRAVDYKELYVNNLNWAENHLKNVFLLDVTELKECKRRMQEYCSYCVQGSLDQYTEKAKAFFDALDKLEEVPNLLNNDDNNSDVESYLGYEEKGVSLAKTEFHKPGSKLTGKFKLPHQFVMDVDNFNKQYPAGLTKVKLMRYVNEACSQPKVFFDSENDMRKKFHDLLVEKSTGVRPVRPDNGCVVS